VRYKLTPANWILRLANFMYKNKELFDTKVDALVFRDLLPRKLAKEVPYETCRNLVENGFELKTEKYILEEILENSNAMDAVVIRKRF